MATYGPTFPFPLDGLAEKLIDAGVILGLDTEFSSLDFWDPDWCLRTVQIDDGSYTYVFDVQDPEQNEVVRQIMAGPVEFTSHNDADVISIRVHFGIDISDRNYDTLTLADMLWPRDKKLAHLDPHDLKSLCTKYVGPELQRAQDALHARFRELLGKDPEAKLTEKMIAEGFRVIDTYDPVYIAYAAADAKYGRKLFFFMEAEMYKKGVHKAWPKECEIRAMATRMRIRGMQTSPGTLESLLDAWGGRLSSALAHFQETYGLSARSPKVADLLLESGVKLEKTTAKGGWSMTGAVIEELLEKYPDNEILQTKKLVSDNSNVATVLTTLKGCLDTNGIVHSSISTLGTVTGRWSVTDFAVQTVTGDARAVFVSRYEGGVIISADLGQIEPRVAVGLAIEENLIPDLYYGIDVYSAAANAVFGPNYTPAQRKKIKRVILGTLYGAGAPTLVKQARMLDGWTDATLGEIQKVRGQWKKAAPAIEAYSKYLQTLPIVRLESGRYVPQDPDRLYKAINSACQGTARDLLMDRAVEIDKKYPDYLIMTMHDELLLDVPGSKVVEVCTFVRSIMEMGYAGIPTPTDIEIYPNGWGSQGMTLEDYFKEYHGQAR